MIFNFNHYAAIRRASSAVGWFARGAVKSSLGLL